MAKQGNIRVTLTDNSEEYLEALKRAHKKALTAIGIEAEGFAKETLTRIVYTGNRKYKLTGRLRNSITWATKKQEGKIQTYKDDEGKTYQTEIGKGADDDSVYVGTNVEYALGIEIGSHRKAGAVHYLQDAAQNHASRYKKLTEDALKSEKVDI